MILPMRCQGMSRPSWCMRARCKEAERNSLEASLLCAGFTSWREVQNSALQSRRSRIRKVCMCTHASVFDLHDNQRSVISEQWLTVADTQPDKCTLIYGGNKAVLCEPGTLKGCRKRDVNTGQIYVCVLKSWSGAGVCLLKPFGWGSKMLGTLSNAGSLADNRDRFLMPLPICRYGETSV